MPTVPPRAEKALASDKDVVLHYIDKTQEAFTSNRTYANRVLVLQTVVALLTIGIAIGAAEGTKFTIGSADFTIEVWALLVAGAVFVGLTPGFVIGRLIYNADLSRDLHDRYAELEPALTQPAVTPWEIAPLVTEAGWATHRSLTKLQAFFTRGRKRKRAGRGERLGTFSDIIGGPLTFIVLFALLPLITQAVAGAWLVRSVDSTGWGQLVGAASALFALFVILSIWSAARRLTERAERLGTHPLRAGGEATKEADAAQ